MTKPADFHILDVVTTYTGIMLTPAGVSGIYEVLNHMTGDNLMTHQLPMASRAVLSAMKGQHPWLDDIVVPRGLSAEQAMGLASHITATHPPMVTLTPAPELWGEHDPMEDLIEIRGGSTVGIIPVAVREAPPIGTVARGKMSTGVMFTDEGRLVPLPPADPTPEKE